jgi:cation:H+ antiporter
LFLITLLIGLLMLVAGADMLVRGAGQFALALRVPALVVGLTIVAFGTSMPELCVSIAAALEASTEMALANVNGSNIANILLVLGCAALVAPLAVNRSLIRREIPACLLLQLLVPIVCLGGRINRFEGLLLLAVGVGYNLWLLHDVLGGRRMASDGRDDHGGLEIKQWKKHLALMLFGTLTLIAGAYLFIDSAEKVALYLGMSDRYIGVTVVALGTSAPEVVTALVSAYRGEVDLAIGNSVGSNILNVSMVLGITAMITPVVFTDPGTWSDIGIAVLVTFVLGPVVLRGKLGRIEGALMILGYGVFIAMSAS